VEHLTWTGTKNAALIVFTKSNIIKSILEIALLQQLETNSLTISDKFDASFWQPMGKFDFEYLVKYVGHSQIRQSCCIFENCAV
jgi:hypothetical protein